MTTVQRVSNRISAVGVGLRNDHDPGNATNQAIVAASADIAYYLSMRYTDLDTLSENGWVQSVCTCRAIMYLCMWRLNAVPPSLLLEWQAYEDKLIDVQTGKGNIPGLPVGTSRDRTPILVHVTNTLLGPRGLAVTGPNGLPVASSIAARWSSV